MYGQQPSFDHNNYNPAGQYPNNQHATGYYQIILQKQNIKKHDTTYF